MMLLKKLTRFLSAVVDGFVALIKPYDASGFKVQPYDGVIYNHFSHASHYPIVGALVFLNGRQKGETYFLNIDKTYRIGTGCLSDIVITPEEPNVSEKNLELSISRSDVRVRSESFDHPCFVNGHANIDAKLIDQDECEFNGARFAFMRLL